MSVLTTILSCLFLLVLLANMVLMYKHDLQMLQQNSYRHERYVNWLKQSHDWRASNRLWLVLLLMANTGTVYLSIALLFGIFLACRAASKKYKKPIVFTPRVWRLMTANLLFSLALMAATWVVFETEIAICSVATLLSIFSYSVTLLSLQVLKPVEETINKHYYDDAARILSQMPDMKIVGITGSYGKTSTKHYLNRILSEKYDVLMTPGSYNTPMGVIRTIREMLKPYNNLFIVEMGAKNIGDIKEICDLVHPQMGIITAVGPQHLESFKTIENVQRTKFELADALPADGYVVVNNDFPYIANREIRNVAHSRYAVSHTDNADYRAENIEYSPLGTSFTIVGNDGTSIDLQTRLVGECNISNLLAAVIVALKLQVPVDKIRYAVSKIEQVEHRLNMKRTPGGITIIDDAFNSNPDGSRMALDVISRMTQGKRIVITPGMIELGDKQHEYNLAFGKHMASSCDLAIVVGKYNREAIVEGLKQGGMPADAIVAVDSFAEAQTRMLATAKPGDTVLYENDLPDTFK